MRGNLALNPRAYVRTLAGRWVAAHVLTPPKKPGDHGQGDMNASHNRNGSESRMDKRL